METGNGVQSALNNYDTDDYNTAGVIAHENLKKPKIIQAVKSIAEQIPDEDLIRVHKEGLSATKRSGTGGMKIGIGTDGTVNDIGHSDIDEPDYAVRHKYLDSAYKLKGVYAPEKSINLEVTAHVTDPKLKEVNEEYNRKVFEALKDNG